MIDWTLFNKEYPTDEGIVNCLPPELQYKVEVVADARKFTDVHSTVMEGRDYTRFLTDKQEMAKAQKEFYDKFAVGYQWRADVDQVFKLKVRRLFEYDLNQFGARRGKLLFIGAGNSRTAGPFAEAGFQVCATDISMNMLKVGRANTKPEMTYVAHNAELPFPFKDETFDAAYSICVINHITDWDNYLTEKLRCLKSGSILLERMPNSDLWSFWKDQGELNKGIEVKAAYCNRRSAEALLSKFNLKGQVWTHDRQPDICNADHQRYIKESSKEDSTVGPSNDDLQGTYTLFKVVKS